MKKIIYIILVLSISQISFAKEEGEKQVQKPTPNGNENASGQVTTANIQVQGMVCAFCAQGVEKGFKAKPEVKGVKVDLDKMQVRVDFQKGKKLPQKEIEEVITGAGFAFKGLKYE